MSKLEKKTLKECLSLIIDNRGKTPPKSESGLGYKILSANHVKFDGLVKIDSIEYGSVETYSKWMAEELKRGDILLTSEAPAGQVMLWDSDEKVIVAQRLFALRADPEVADNKFLKYYLQSNLGQKEITRNTSGSTVFGISARMFDQINVHLPECTSVQSDIGNILYSLDKKIELNNRINAELEAMAKTLYDYWFVQFDFPDKNGKPYKTSGGKMVYNPNLKREIPEGWESTPLSKITPVSNQSVNPADYSSKVFRHFSIPVYDSTKTFGLEAGETIGSNKFTVTENDILVSKLNPWFSRVIYAMDEDDLICSTEFVVWRTPSNSIKNFLYMVATSPQFVAHCTQSATGTSNSHKRVNPGVMMRFEVAFKEEVASALGKKLEPMIKKMVINQRENTELSKLRDWLLPMLMNGQVTVK